MNTTYMSRKLEEVRLSGMNPVNLLFDKSLRKSRNKLITMELLHQKLKGIAVSFCHWARDIGKSLLRFVIGKPFVYLFSYLTYIKE